MRDKIISLILLAAFGLPGVCSEGLHRLLPFGIGMLFHQNALGDNGQAPNVPSQAPIKFNQNCPICHFCAQLITVAALFVFFLLLQRLTRFVEAQSANPFLPFDRARYLRGPPANAC